MGLEMLYKFEAMALGLSFCGLCLKILTFERYFLGLKRHILDILRPLELLLLILFLCLRLTFINICHVCLENFRIFRP